jgi:hypothetical protein
MLNYLLILNLKLTPRVILLVIKHSLKIFNDFNLKLLNIITGILKEGVSKNLIPKFSNNFFKLDFHMFKNLKTSELIS